MMNVRVKMKDVIGSSVSCVSDFNMSRCCHRAWPTAVRRYAGVYVCARE